MCFKMGNMLNLKLVRPFPICQLLQQFLNIAKKVKQRARVKLSDCFASGLENKSGFDRWSIHYKPGCFPRPNYRYRQVIINLNKSEIQMVTLQLRQIIVPPGHWVLLDDVNWQEFEAILEELGEHRGSRIAYSQGTLEIRMPLPEHEFNKEIRFYRT